MGQVRRMSYRPGGIGGPGDDGQGGGATARTLPSGLTVQAPYRVGASPAAGAGSGAGPLRWLPVARDYSPQTQWRLIWLGLAVAYVCGWHASIGRLRVRI